jgi:hypothetical protein
MRLAALCCCLLFLAGSVRAQDQGAVQASTSDAPLVSEEFVRLFRSYCLEKFPDDIALAAQAGEDKFVALTPAEVKGVLHDDPGQGWLITGQDAKYILTVEQPPFHTCALRRQAAIVFSSAPLVAAAKDFVEAKGGKLSPPQTQDFPAKNGLHSSAVYFPELDSQGKPTGETFMYFVVGYPARVRPDAPPSQPFFEMRFVRQIYRQRA